MCHHGCEVLETAPYLFWYCDFVGRLDYRFSSPFSRLFVVLHIVRAVIFRCLWLHRNDIRFHDCQANVMDRYYQDLLFKSLSHSGLQQRSLHELLASLHLTKAQPLCPDAMDHKRFSLCDAKLGANTGYSATLRPPLKFTIPIFYASKIGYFLTERKKRKARVYRFDFPKRAKLFGVLAFFLFHFLLYFCYGRLQALVFFGLLSYCLRMRPFGATG
ncbi:hypothetical protein Plhal703r1_c27g0111621 [Plasmopara halstedii]